jgi:hypothetical protein
MQISQTQGKGISTNYQTQQQISNKNKCGNSQMISVNTLNIKKSLNPHQNSSNRKMVCKLHHH